MKLFACGTASVAVLSLTGHALALEPIASASLTVTRDAPSESCMSPGALERAVEGRLGRDVFRPAGSEIAVSVRFSREENDFVAVITLHDAKGRPFGVREIRSPARHCSALDESVPLVVALLVDAPPEPPEPEPEPVEPPLGERVPPAKPPEPPRPVRLALPPTTPAPRTPARWELNLGATGLLGLLPNFGVGLELGVGVDIPALTRVRGFVAGYLPNREQRPGSESGVELSLLRAGLEICPFESASDRFVAGACIGQVVSRVHAEGFGFFENERGDRLSYGLRAGAFALLRVGGSFHLRAGLAVEVPLQRTNYAFRAAEGTSEFLYRSAPFGGNGDLGVLFAFE
jgi:hypothetical protein